MQGFLSLHPDKSILNSRVDEIKDDTSKQEYQGYEGLFTNLEIIEPQTTENKFDLDGISWVHLYKTKSAYKSALCHTCISFCEMNFCLCFNCCPIFINMLFKPATAEILLECVLTKICWFNPSVSSKFLKYSNSLYCIAWWKIVITKAISVNLWCNWNITFCESNRILFNLK